MRYFRQRDTGRRIRLVAIKDAEIARDRVYARFDGDHAIGCLPTNPAAFRVPREAIRHIPVAFTLIELLIVLAMIVFAPSRADAQSPVQDAMRGYQESYNRVARQGAARQQEQIRQENLDRIAREAAKARFKRKHRSLVAGREHPVQSKPKAKAVVKKP